MEAIFKNYFGCKNPFDDYGKITPEGEVAQEKLIQLLKDLALVIPDVISEDDARTAERMIDDICCENYDWETRVTAAMARKKNPQGMVCVSNCYFLCS